MARNNTQFLPADEDNPTTSRRGQHPDASELLPRLEMAGQRPRPEPDFNDVLQNEGISVLSAPSSRSRSVRVDETDRAAQASQSQRRAAENIEGNDMENFSRQAQRHRSRIRHWQPNINPPQPQVTDTEDRLAGATQHGLTLHTANQDDAMFDVTRVAMSTLPGSSSSNTRPGLHNVPAGQPHRLNPSGFHNIPAGRQFSSDSSYGSPSISTTSGFNNTSDNLYVGGSKSAPPQGMQARATSGFNSRRPAMPSSQYYSAQHDLAAQGTWQSDTDETIFQAQYWHRLDQASQQTLLNFPAEPISQRVILSADQLPAFSSTDYYNQAGQQYTGMNSTTGSSSDVNTERFDVAERRDAGPQLSLHPRNDSQPIYNRGNQPAAVTVPISVQPRVASSFNSPSSIQPRVASSSNIQPRSTHFAQRRIRSRSSENPADRNPFLDPITGQLPRYLQVLPPGYGPRIETDIRPRFRSVLHRTADGEVIIRDPNVNGREYVLRYHPLTGRPHYLEDLILHRCYRIQPTSDTYFGYLEGAYNVVMEISYNVIHFGAPLLPNMTPPSSSPGPSRRLDPHH